METLNTQLAEREVILIDGGTGTELEKRGVPMDHAAWSATAVLTHPQVVREVHEDYIRAGARIIITNTYSTARHVLEPAGLSEQVLEINQMAVKLARQARRNVADKTVYIGGSISPFYANLDKQYEPAPEVAETSYREQANLLTEAGVDLIMLESMSDRTHTLLAVQAAIDTGLPVWVGFSCYGTSKGELVLWDRVTTLADGLGAVTSLKISAITIMHTLVEFIAPAVDVVKAYWNGPIGAYAHSGTFIMPNWQFDRIISPQDYSEAAIQWVQQGVQIIGGCCGTGPEHIRKLKDTLPRKLLP